MSSLSREDLLEKLRPVIAEQLGVDDSEVTEEASFIEDLNADSLDLVELIMAFEEKFQDLTGKRLEISDEDAEKITTVGEAVEYMQEHMK
jgi:acyl carrier protein